MVSEPAPLRRHRLHQRPATPATPPPPPAPEGTPPPRDERGAGAHDRLNPARCETRGVFRRSRREGFDARPRAIPNAASVVACVGAFLSPWTFPLTTPYPVRASNATLPNEVRFHRPAKRCTWLVMPHSRFLSSWLRVPGRFALGLLAFLSGFSRLCDGDPFRPSSERHGA